jgi:ATPase family AAA domain-containing protein 3A/B
MKLRCLSLFFFLSSSILSSHPHTGTGKTLWAEKLAQEAKMDFAIMSGPSFDQFIPGEAIQEIKLLFNWVHAQKNGVLLFIDEADSFLEDRATLHPHRVSVLNEWINQTGTESQKFMCVYETNRPEVLDPAIQSRVSTSIEFESPGEAELLKLLQLYVKKYVTDNRKSGMELVVVGRVG